MDLKRTLVFRGSYATKTRLEQLLRALYAEPAITPATWLYSDDDKATKIKIYRSHPGRILYYPCLILSTAAHEPNIQSFNMEKEVASEEMVAGTLSKQTATGYVAIPIDIKIFAKQGDDRDQLTDHLVSILRILGRSQSTKVWWNKIRVRGDDQMIDTDHSVIFTNTITILTHTDYTQVLTPDQIAFINKIMEEVEVVADI